MREIHIAAGLLALLAGAIALWAAKGSPLHRHGGRLFVIAMIVMTVSAAVSAFFLRPHPFNGTAAVLTFYLVCTGMLTVTRPVAAVRGLTAGLALLALAAGLHAFNLGFAALASPKGHIGGIPAPPLFMFGIVGVLGAALDVRLLRAGRIAGHHRLARHLWRMTYALWIATMSFFLGQAKVFPEPVRKMALLGIPVLIVTVLFIYWLARVLIKRERAVSAVVIAPR